MEYIQIKDVVVERAEYNALINMAEKECRHPSAQLRVILRDALQRARLLPTDEPECIPASQQEPSHASH